MKRSRTILEIIAVDRKSPINFHSIKTSTSPNFKKIASSMIIAKQLNFGNLIISALSIATRTKLRSEFKELSKEIDNREFLKRFVKKVEFSIRLLNQEKYFRRHNAYFCLPFIKDEFGLKMIWKRAEQLEQRTFSDDKKDKGTQTHRDLFSFKTRKEIERKEDLVVFIKKECKLNLNESSVQDMSEIKDILKILEGVETENKLQKSRKSIEIKVGKEIRKYQVKKEPINVMTKTKSTVLNYDKKIERKKNESTKRMTRMTYENMFKVRRTISVKGFNLKPLEFIKK